MKAYVSQAKLVKFQENLKKKTCVSEAKMELKGEKETLNLYKIGVGGLRR